MKTSTLITVSEAVAFLTASGLLSPAGAPFGASTIRRACALGFIRGARLVGKTWVMTPAAVSAWATAPEKHRPGRRTTS